jgi:hypothetical protein
MPATGQNVTQWAGDTLSLRIPILNPDGTKPNLAGASGKWWLAPAATSAAAQALLKKEGLALQNAATAPTLVVDLAPLDTRDLLPGLYYHEAEITDANGNVSTVMTGRFTLQPAVIK